MDGEFRGRGKIQSLLIDVSSGVVGDYGGSIWLSIGFDGCMMEGFLGSRYWWEWEEEDDEW